MLPVRWQKISNCLTSADCWFINSLMPFRLLQALNIINVIITLRWLKTECRQMRKNILSSIIITIFQICRFILFSIFLKDVNKDLGSNIKTQNKTLNFFNKLCLMCKADVSVTICRIYGTRYADWLRSLYK